MVPTRYAERLRHVSPWIYKLAAQSWIDRTYPRHLFIETTAACNLTCSYCPRERRGNHMDFALFTALIDEATTYGPRSFSLHLFGEPLLYPKILEAISYIKRANPKHTVLLTTNGTRLNAMAVDVIAAGVDKIIWTWRPEATFTPQTKEVLKKWGKFMVRILIELTPADAQAEWSQWRPREIKSLHNYGGQIDLSRWSANISSDSFTLVESSASVAGLKGISSTRWPCYHLWLAPAVAWNGNILICCADPHQKEVLGHFPEVKVAEAWQGNHLAAVRKSHLEGDYGGICAGCDSWKTYPDLFYAWQKSTPIGS